jgi:hypothetical protein
MSGISFLEMKKAPLDGAFSKCCKKQQGLANSLLYIFNCLQLIKIQQRQPPSILQLHTVINETETPWLLVIDVFIRNFKFGSLH